MPTPGPSKKIPQDWHPWDIKAALGKRGYSLRKVALDNGYAITSANDALRKQWPNMERIIADIIGVEPWEIWPSRYDENNLPLHRYGARTLATKRRVIP